MEPRNDIFSFSQFSGSLVWRNFERQTGTYPMPLLDDLVGCFEMKCN